MAGSKEWFAYVANNGVEYGISLDASNTNAVNASAPLPTLGVVHSVPKNVRPRFVVYVNAAGTRRIRVVVLTPTAFSTIETDSPSLQDPLTPGQTLTLDYTRPEVLRPAIKRTNTGLVNP